MARVTFYEKPGCGTNRKQKALLAEAGHEVIARDLLSEPWTAERLRGFFGATPVATWLNPAAPRVKSREIDPAQIDALSALSAMLADPLLIRRPLIEAEGQFCAGFDREPVLSLLRRVEAPADAQGCSRPGDAPSCPAPKKAIHAE